MEIWLSLLIGAGLVILLIRFLSSILYELVLFGALFWLLELYRHWAIEYWGMPTLPFWVGEVYIGAAIAWIGYRLLLVLANLSKPRSPIRKFTKLVFGKVEKLK